MRYSRFASRMMTLLLLSLVHTAIQAQFTLVTSSGSAGYASLALALTAMSTNPGHLFLPGGNISVSSTINLYAEQQIEGQSNSVLLATSGMNASTMIVCNGNNIRIRRVGLNRNITTRPASLGDGIDVNGYNNVVLHEVNILQQRHGVVSDVSGRTPNQLILRHSFIGWCVESFVRVAGDGVDQMVIEHVAFNSAGNIGLDIKGTFNAYPTTGQARIYLQNLGISIVDGDALKLTGENFIVENIYTDRVDGHGINLTNVDESIIHSNIITGCGMSVTKPAVSGTLIGGWSVGTTTFASGCHGIIVDKDCSSDEIRDNNIFYNAHDGIRVAGHPTSGQTGPIDIKIINNTLKNNGFAAGTNGAGIRITGGSGAFAKNIQVAGNRAYNDSGYTANQKYGIQCDTIQATSLFVLGNNCIDPSDTDGITIDGSTTPAVNADNAE